MTDFQTLESLAREICDSRNSAGHYDAKGTKRAYWRARAEEMLALAEAMPAYRTLALATGWRAMGWPV